MKLAVFAIGFSLAWMSALAQPTHIMVRAQALDAKFIGDHTGGADIILTDARTGKVLAKGRTAGGTGDTGKIMKAPNRRGGGLTDAQTAGLDLVIDISAPTLVRAEAVGPQGRPASAIHVTSTSWIYPGHDITGDGWILTLPGLVVEPKVETGVNGILAVLANVTLMCGCPIEAGGLWDSANYSVEATLIQGGKTLATTPLTFTGKTSQFAGQFAGQMPGRYTVRVTASDRTTINASVVEMPWDLKF
ncbi:MAG: hypothetical protein CGW95_06340 [Phenylobacterium zucineum]|nr:MAG: hypothetical protein CGW95_06340 [Phenylobacterium zucineum]